LRPTLTIIGCGKVGKSLGRLWHTHQAVSLRQVLNRNAESARQAVAFMEAGQAVEAYSDLLPADLYLIAVPDERIADCSRLLAATGLLKRESIVFHCSGALSADIMEDVIASGAAVASVHPIRSFASPEQVIASFEGTWSGMEGTARALPILERLFRAIGARTVEIDSSKKMLYHAAAVFASNYLVTLADIALEAYQEAGIPRETGLQMIAPLMRKTLDNLLSMGPEQALSGPVARGDWQTVEKQYRAIAAWDEECASLYKQLAARTKALTKRHRDIHHCQ
jgi:predicted short-subunit dehydrogenase-like oxidoreductase (DUF2520 family)